MKCQKCGEREATIHSVSIINGVKNESFICSLCADRENNISFNFPSVNDFFKSFAMGGTTKNTMKCLICGYSYDDFLNTGLMGCPECYESFRGELMPVIKKYQAGNCENKMDTAEVKPAAKEFDKLKELNQKLNEAISLENFEEAAVIRDKIRELESNE